MRILWLSHLVPYPPKGGVLQRSYNLIRQLARYHEVYLLAFIQSKLIKRAFAEKKSGELEARRVLAQICREVEFVEIPFDSTRLGRHLIGIKSLLTGQPYDKCWYRSNHMAMLVREWCREKGFDAVHFDTIGLASLLPLVGSVQTVLDHHNIESHLMARRAKNEKRLWKRLYFSIEARKLEKYEKTVCRQFGVNITCSQLDADRLFRIEPNVKVCVIPNGVDTEYFKPLGLEVIPKSLVFAGSMNWYPNRRAMLYFGKVLWPLLKEHIPEISVDVIGSDPPRELKRLSEIDKAFRVHGFVDDVRPYIDRAAVYICPIDDGGGTKLKILDAMAMGKAIVAHPISCEGINIAPGKDAMLASNASEFLSCISRLLESNRLRARLGASARSVITSQYSYSAIGNQLSELFSALGNSAKKEKKAIG